VYEKKYVPLLPEDLLLFFSDCVIETQNADGKMLSDQDVMKSVHTAMLENHANPAMHAMQSVLHQLHSHQSKPIVDDLTINVYWRCKR
jgi:serine phosphatase RsbU (regulator of sigma subunit)